MPNVDISAAYLWIHRLHRAGYSVRFYVMGVLFADQLGDVRRHDHPIEYQLHFGIDVFGGSTEAIEKYVRRDAAHRYHRVLCVDDTHHFCGDRP